MSSLTRDLHKNFTMAGNVLHSLLKEGESRRYSSEELIKLCSVIVTAEYCVETVQQLEEKLKEKVPKAVTEQIDFTDEKIQDVENGCDSALTIMAKKPWHTIKSVGDQSDFINQLIYHFKTVIPLIRENLHTSRKYFTQLCLKFANAFIAKYITVLYKCRFNSADGSSNILGCEQLLLDTHSLKTVLLNLPSIESMVNRQAPANYTKVVVKGMNQAEMIIKIVMTPVSPPQMFNSQVLNLLPEITISEYQKLLDLKALKRQEQVELVDLFKVAAGERAIRTEEVKVEDEKSLSKRALNTTSKFMSSSAEQGSRILNLEKLMKKGLYFNS
uniref:Vps53 C-terminal domain-containing protein n=1 Tax=Megaselia scalaris TaxID=36166 RepID=T1H365_MEGSC